MEIKVKVNKSESEQKRKWDIVRLGCGLGSGGEVQADREGGGIGAPPIRARRNKVQAGTEKQKEGDRSQAMDTFTTPGHLLTNIVIFIIINIAITLITVIIPIFFCNLRSTQ